MKERVDSVSSIYIYHTHQKAWKNTGANGVYCLAYQVSGWYDHTFARKELTVKSDTLFFIERHTPYTVKCLQEGEAICVTFYAELELSSSVYDCSSHPEIKNLFQRLLNYKNLAVKSNQYEAMAIIYRLLAFISQSSSPEYVRHVNRDKMQKAYEYLTEHHADPLLKTGELAREFEMSPKCFRTLFKKLYNITPTQALIQLRLQSAVRLLTETNLGIGEIAAMTGFLDVYHFSKLFKQKFGCPPTEHRKRASSVPVISVT